MRVDRLLDCIGKLCPEPVIDIAEAIMGMESGEVIEMRTTDPGSEPDMVAWSRRTGHKVIDQKVENKVFVYYVRKK
ncbi:MAG: response regulator SirA [bacterium]|nr:MAG: response regulator SirA [bacterium]